MGNYLLLGALIVLCVVLGWVVRGIMESNQPLQKIAMGYGYEEKSNVWNRIRVDEQGYVMCHKDGQ